MNMICLQCDNEVFVVKPETELEQEFRGETLKVHTPAMACVKCGWVTIGQGQLDELRKRTADAYRVKHGLLTSAQIKEMRLSLNKSQREFADFLRVGEASVKRWETWQVQDASNDELIRVKFEIERLRSELAAYPALPVKLENSDPAGIVAESFLGSLVCHFSAKGSLLDWVSWEELEPLGPKQLTVIIPSKENPALHDVSTSPYLGEYAARMTMAVPSTSDSQTPIDLTSADSFCASNQTRICGLSPPSNPEAGRFFFSNASSELILKWALKKKCPISNK